jgi:malate synthase
MEDAATAEICRAQVWQWVHYRIALAEGTTATRELLERLLTEEMARVRQEVGAQAFEQGRFDEAVRLFRELSVSADFEDFLTVPALPLLRAHEAEESAA